ncbi:protoporphyrinogen oxidase [Aeromicrobium chenweiae]|uniref:Coproporphyrinogen III oxidase n=1 Tax=Aeromicrobium chenweiae TaxID=2079793 RepID=A0A2S0WMP7_9ACTN|nr:protoporphyrinogen oxidase [Aeromicrobium chenweiae]AWB92618.1 protoporphyrinogen oxidase [Aeromicrobium chenweiae]TGN33606.1 protoporphyrinogen oxidase [Aeromicrobium chenweiae]
MKVAVVGGGMAGLAAAYELASSGAEAVVLEGSDRLGGKLRLGEVGGLTLDLGAESVLARRPEGLDLIHAVGLDDRVVHPATTTAAIWTHGALRPMPPTVMGIPADPAALAASGIAELQTPRLLPVPDHDVSVAEFVTERLGRDVLDRLVEPLLGGVYAGTTDHLSLRATTPQIAGLGEDLIAAAAANRAAATRTGPVFAGLVGGIGQLPAAVAATPGIEVRLDATVRAVARAGDGWRLSVGPTTDVETIHADAVVVAAPAPAAARLLAVDAPAAAFALAAIDYASMAIITFVLDDAEVPEGSGFLVPPVDGTFIKAATVSSNKWGWVGASGRTVIRTSVGRAGESTLLQYNDADLAARALADLRQAFGALPDPMDQVVHRWGGGLPQYDVGHLDRVETIERSVAEVPGLEVCGAAYRGVGIPAVIASGRAAARRLLDAGTMAS